MQSERVGFKSAVIPCKHQNDLHCNFLPFVKHLAGIFVWTNFYLRLFALVNWYVRAML